MHYAFGVDSRLNKKDGTPSSTENALRLLEAFTIEEPEMGITELADKLGIAKSTVHRLVTTMEAEGFIKRDPERSLYRLGTSILALGNMITTKNNIYMISLPVLESITDLCNESAHLTVLAGSNIFYLSKLEYNYYVGSRSYIGKKQPAFCTSSGQVILAFQSHETINKVIEKGFIRYTPNTIVTKEKFNQKLELIRKQGFAVAVEEYDEGIVGISAPIRNYRGHVIAAINIAGPTNRLTTDKINQYSKILTDAGNAISKKLKYQSG